MMENQPSNPVDPGSVPEGSDSHSESPHVPHLHKKEKQGHFDGFTPRREAAHHTPHHFASPHSEPAPQHFVAPDPAAAAPAAPKRSFGTEGGKPAAPKQPSQLVRSVVPVNPIRRPIDRDFEWMRFIFLAAVMVPLCIWGSLPSWESMVYEWYHSDDYSHGFLVIPATIFFLYVRRDSYPGTSYKLDWVGLLPLFLYAVFRIFAGRLYMDPLDAAAIFFWVLSIVWFFYGWRVFLWALPSLCFLVFMFQLPWRIDVLMRNHLQLFAAQSASVLLTLVGETAVPIKNTIRLSTMELGVAEACSGLRFLMSVFAIAFATVLLMRRPWWQNILIVVIAAPLALFVNAMRIAITGYLLVHFYDMVAARAREGQSVSSIADTYAGYVAIALALGLFALFVWYLGKVFKQVEI